MEQRQITRTTAAEILTEGNLKATNDNMLILSTGLTYEKMKPVSDEELFLIRICCEDGLQGIYREYQCRREVLSIPSDLEETLDTLTRSARAIGNRLKQNNLNKYLRPPYMDYNPDELDDMLETMRRLAYNATQAIEAVTLSQSPKREGYGADTALFVRLYLLFSKLGGKPRLGGTGPFYRFAKASTKFIDPDLSFPSPSIFRDRIRKHQERHGDILKAVQKNRDREAKKISSVPVK